MPKQVKIPALKGIAKAVVTYRQMKAAGKIGTISALEAVSPFIGKKGNVLKRETRYNVQRERLTQAVKEAQKQLGKTPGKKTLERIAKKRAEATQKAAKTYAEKAAPKTKQGKADQRFKRQAKEKADQFLQAVDVFSTETYQKLRDGAYGIGSDTVIAAVESGLTAEEVEEYLNQVVETWDDVPDEAKELASSDVFWQSTFDIINTIKENSDIDFGDVFSAFMTAGEDTETFKEVLENYIDYGDYSKSFSEVWADLKDMLDPTNPDNMAELYESEDDV